MKLTTPVLLCALALLGRAPALFGFDVHAYVAALQADAPVPLAIHIHEEETLYALYVREPGASECNWVEYVDKSGQRLNHTGGLKPFSGGFDLAAYLGELCGSASPNPMTGATVNATWRWEGGAYTVSVVENSDYGSTQLFAGRISYHGDVLSSEHFASPSEASGGIGVWEDSYGEPSTEEWLADFNGTLDWLEAWGEANWEDAQLRAQLAFQQRAYEDMWNWDHMLASTDDDPFLRYAFAEEGSIEQWQALADAFRTIFDYVFFGWYSTQLGGGSSSGRISATRTLSVPKVSDPKLANIVSSLFKGTRDANAIGTGSTMDALRYEIATGKMTGGRYHTQKVWDSIRALQRWIRENPNASARDRLVAQSLLDDLNESASRLPGPPRT